MMISFLNFRIVFLLCYLIIYVASDEAEKCILDIIEDMHPENPRMILKKSDNEVKEHIYPLSVNPRSLIFKKDEEFELGCLYGLDITQDDLYLIARIGEDGAINDPSHAWLKTYNPESTFVDKPETVTCKGNNKFMINEKEVTLKSLKCQRPMSSVIREDLIVTPKCANGNGQYLKIAYQLNVTSYLDVITLCHDKENAKTLWARATMKPIRNLYCNTATDDIPYKNNKFSVLLMHDENDPYSIERQYKTFTVTLSQSKADAHLNHQTCKEQYLSKGELISHKDLFYPSEQLASFHFLNVMPIWEKIRISNWEIMEDYIRKLAIIVNHDIELWTGGIGQVHLNSSFDIPTPIFLADRTKIPVPLKIYKCAIDKEEKKGICFIIINNPYVAENAYEYIKTTYIQHDILPPWNEIFQIQDSTTGYTFCCKPSDFYNSYKNELGLDGFENYINYEAMKYREPDAYTELQL